MSESKLMTSAYRNILRKLIVESTEGVSVESFHGVLAGSDKRFKSVEQHDAAF